MTLRQFEIALRRLKLLDSRELSDAGMVMPPMACRDFDRDPADYFLSAGPSRKAQIFALAMGDDVEPAPEPALRPLSRYAFPGPEAKPRQAAE